MRRAGIEKLLPAVFQGAAFDGSVLAAALEAMEELHARTEAELESFERNLDPARAPEAFVPFLARWVNVGVQVTTGLERLRSTVATAVELGRWRGTAGGLLAFLEVATGVSGFEVDEAVPAKGGSPRAFHVRVRAPAALGAHEEMLQRIIRLEKPAYVTHELVFGDR